VTYHKKYVVFKFATTLKIKISLFFLKGIWKQEISRQLCKMKAELLNFHFSGRNITTSLSQAYFPLLAVSFVRITCVQPCMTYSELSRAAMTSKGSGLLWRDVISM